jgi:signal transduction histidine kinase
VTPRRRLLATTWAFSALLPLAAAAGVYTTAPRARVHPVDHALWAVAAASSLWCAALSTWLVLRLTGAHAAIVAAAGRVAAGDAEGRVEGLSASGRVDELGRAVNAAITALDRLATSQRHFVTHAAHGLRQPVQGLLDALVPLSRGEADGADARERAWESAQRVALLAEDLLAPERIGVALRDSAVLSLREVASAALEPVRAEARARGVALGVDGDGRARGRASDLQRLVRHLLENAVRHSPSGAPVRVIIRDDPPFVTLRVRDQGAGVSSADRQRVFEPFARVGGESGGDDPGGGLGLAIVREIARAHGGDASLDPADPARRGATFTVRLPRG